jgi:hypothetical protein
MERKTAQSVVEYFIIMVVVLSAVVALRMGKLDGRLISAFRAYFDAAVQQMR